jgi:hypothetical protein
MTMREPFNSSSKTSLSAHTSKVLLALVISFVGLANAQVSGIGACVASGNGVDYQVGDGKQYASLDQVPWPNLGPGDTVRIFHRATPFRGKMLVMARGTPTNPVRICGVKGANGERPIVDGNNAITRRGMIYGSGGSTVGSVSWYHQARSVIVLKAPANNSTLNPTNIQIDGLVLRGAHPNYTFTDTDGAVQTYTEFGGCIWVEQGQGVVIADNELTDCSQGIYTKTIVNGDSAITKNVRIAGNYFHDLGVSGKYTLHDSYTESTGIVYEFNRFGTAKLGAAGNAIKDRSIGTVIRYNRIEDGAHALDLVEADASGPIAVLDPTYKQTFVYGNQIIHNGNNGTAIHYGGDLTGGEAQWRKGTLYFFNNSVRLTGTGAVQLFQLSTTEETAYAWNNVFAFDPTVQYASLRAPQDVSPPYVSSGILNLGRNLIVGDWADSDPYHPLTGQLNGTENIITRSTSPIDPITLMLNVCTNELDVGQAAPAAVAAAVANHPVLWQLSTAFAPVPRTTRGAAMDLGGIENVDGAFNVAEARAALAWMFGVRGAALESVSGFPGMTGVVIDQLLQAQKDSLALDLDGDNKVYATTDGLMLLRATLGLTGDPVTAKAVNPQGVRTTWSAVRGHLVSTCKLPP